ncbi:tRNA lysidine(34) synthetase TilS [Flavobacterium sp.]|uniref:tRNA lysidine(34) synthetase TilS n=1 Tax=Flavobacterium sp. TaxID=239 RepID=UPI0038FD27BE
MLQKIQYHISEFFPFLYGKKLLLATSGGIDSMVMVELFRKMPFEIAMAHCNFQLRGLESFEDQKFIQNYAEANDVKLFLTHFDTEAFAKEYKLSIQVAARELRYHWFQEIIDSEKFDFILTAHHADDNAETFFINLTRGTGIEGLTGIPSQNGNIIRPLLIFSREEIEKFAKVNNIEWREDSSNASDKYLRNKIRHSLIPVLKEMNPDFLSTFNKTQNYIQDSISMIEDAANMVYQHVANEIDEQIHFDIIQLKKINNYNSYLYYWLKDYGFSAWQDIYDLVDGQTGKLVYSNDYRLLKNRGALILIPKNVSTETEKFLIDKNQTKVNFPLNLSFCKVADISVGSNTTIFVDANKLEYPLVLRKPIKGDFLHPFGMNGKTKKLSKLFKDEKLSLIEKEDSWVLCSENQIVWVIGLRQDDRFKIESKTTNILKIEVEK